ncbi:MAG: phosphate transporter substrate-binding protein PhoT family, partial [Solirubrobacteraceae bacterium]|nr:phosphate transporter substrate-binding protein PhoT family [Solirubrobacteraceae bacterium]
PPDLPARGGWLMSGLRLGAGALAAGFATALLMGCGINTQNAGTAPTPAPRTATGTSTSSRATSKLPKRPNGTVAVDGPQQGSLTPKAIRRVSGVRVAYTTVGDTQGFQDLCNGRIDVLDTSQVITQADLTLCRRKGVDLTTQPIEVAADAVVIATRNESDVGGDCLRLSTVNDIFRAGSPFTNWSQVGFFDIPLQVTGREASSPTFQFFAQAALGVTANASLADVRSDYRLHTTDAGVRNEVTNSARLARVRARFATRVRDLRLERQIAFQAHVDAAIARARKRVLDQIAADNRRRAATNVVLSATQKILIARENLRTIKAATLAAQNRAQANFSFPRLTFLLQSERAALHRNRIAGTIGIFRFSYYELYENLLRPMEVWDPAIAAQALAGMNGVKVVGPLAQNAADAGRTTTTTTTTGTTSTGTTTTGTSTATTGTTTPTGTVAADVPAPTTTDADGNVLVDPTVTPWCVFPSQTTITNGSYPLARRLLLYVSNDNLKRPEVRTFLRSYLNNAQTLATNNRLVPIPDDLLQRQLDTVNGTTATTTTTTTTTPSGATTTATTTTSTTATTTQPQNLPGVSSGTTTAP